MAVARLVETRKYLHECRLSGAVVADHADHLAVIHVEIYIVQCGDRAEVFRDSLGFQDFDTLIQLWFHCSAWI